MRASSSANLRYANIVCATLRKSSLELCIKHPSKHRPGVLQGCCLGPIHHPGNSMKTCHVTTWPVRRHDGWPGLQRICACVCNLMRNPVLCCRGSGVGFAPALGRGVCSLGRGTQLHHDMDSLSALLDPLWGESTTFSVNKHHLLITYIVMKVLNFNLLSRC